MVKKDIYEHLANIYLDASAKKKNKKTARRPDIFKNLFFISTAIIFVLITLLLNNFSYQDAPFFADLNAKKRINSEIALLVQPTIVKINFNFDPAKEEAYNINLNGLDLVRFKALGFLVRKANYEDNIILKVQFANDYKQKSDAYFYYIPSYKWQEYKINFSDFKDIKDWSKMSSLSFIIEEGNVKEKRGVVYIDNVRFLR